MIKRMIFPAVLLVTLLGWNIACSHSSNVPKADSAPSPVSVLVNPNGPVVIRTAGAEFDILPTGYLQASLLKEGGQKLSLDDPPADTSADYAVVADKPTRFNLDFSQTRIVPASGKLGRGKRVEIPA